MKFEAGSTGSQTTKSNSSAKRSLKVAFEPDSVLRPSPIPAFRRIDSLCLPNLLVRDVVRVFNQESALVRNNSILFLLIIPVYSFSQAYDILFIGNSYTYYNDLPEMISSIANDFGDSINHAQSTPGGTSLYAHSQNQATINKINQQNWDYVVLQDQSQRPSLSPSYVAANVYPVSYTHLTLPTKRIV